MNKSVKYSPEVRERKNGVRFTYLTYLPVRRHGAVEPDPETYDSTDAANTRSIVVSRYDAAGRLAFQSYPVRSVGLWTDAALTGTRTTYDALDRVTQVVPKNGVTKNGVRFTYLPVRRHGRLSLIDYPDGDAVENGVRFTSRGGDCVVCVLV